MTAEIVIIGAGLAGWAMAEALVAGGVSPGDVAIVSDPGDGGTSEVPAALLNPYTARQLRLPCGHSRALQCALQKLGGMPPALWSERRILRVIGEDRRSEQLLAAFDVEGGGPEGTSWLTSSELDSLMRPGPGVRGAIAYGGARAVRLGEMVAHMRATALAMGVVQACWRVERLRQAAGFWHLLGSRGQDLRARQVVLACGAGLARWFPGLDLRQVPGELVWLAPGDATLTCLDTGSVIECGAHLMHVPGVGWTLGATYLSPGTPAHPARSPQEVFAELAAEMRPAMDALQACDVGGAWRGVRCVHGSDGLPLAGPVPGHPGLHVLGALGSRGLFWAPALAQAVAKNIVLAGDVGDLEVYGVHTARVRPWRWELASCDEPTERHAGSGHVRRVR